MRFFYLFMLGFLICGDVSAQGSLSFTVDSSDLVYNGLQAIQQFNIKVVNTAGAQKLIAWKREDICEMPVGWEANVCDCNLCLPPSTYEYTCLIDDTCYMTLDYHFNFAAPQIPHTTVFSIYDPADSANTFLKMNLTINAGCNPLNVSHLSKNNDLILFPNPATQGISFEPILDLSKVEIQIFNSVGQMQRVILKSKNSIDVSSFPKGNYLIKIIDFKLNSTFRLVKL